MLSWVFLCLALYIGSSEGCNTAKCVAKENFCYLTDCFCNENPDHTACATATKNCDTVDYDKEMVKEVALAEHMALRTYINFFQELNIALNWRFPVPSPLLADLQWDDQLA